MKQRLRSAAVALAVAAAMTAMVFAPAAQTYAAAKKKTIYVISRITSGDKDDSYKFSYNKNGMVKKVSARSVKSTYKYDKKKVSEEVQEVSGETGKVIYSYDGKGRLKELVSDNPDGTQASVKMTYKSGKLSKINDGTTGSVWKLSYGGKKMPKKATITGNDGSITTIKYTFNAKNDLTKMIGSWDVTETLSYTYNKHGRKKVTVEYKYKDASFNSKEVYTYKYKKITVPASYVKAIKKQQKEMADTPMAYMFVVH